MTKEMQCPLCKGSGAYKESTTQEGVTYDGYVCARCTVLWWEPFKNPGAKWYQEDERYADRNKHSFLVPNKKHIDVLDWYTEEPGRVLDVGCGVGNFLGEAKRRGWEVWGIDFDSDAIKTAQDTFALEHVYVSDVASFAETYTGPRFDLITFFDVFEHLDDHHVFMSSVKTLLRPGGTLAFSVPYAKAWRFLVPADLPPRHLTRSNETSLKHFFAQYGCSIGKVSRLPASWYYLVLKLRFKYGKQLSFGGVRAVEGSLGEGKRQKRETPLTVRVVKLLAKAKDSVVFGIPAFMLWVLLLPSDGRYTDIYGLIYDTRNKA